MPLNHFLYLSSDDSKTYYPNNTPSNFYIKILNPMVFRSMRVCGLVSFQYIDSFSPSSLPTQSSHMNMYICSNMCQHSFVNDSTLPVLTRIKIDISNDSKVKEVPIFNPLYVSIVEYFTNDIHIYIKDDDGKDISFLGGPSKFTLHLKS